MSDMGLLGYLPDGTNWPNDQPAAQAPPQGGNAAQSVAQLVTPAPVVPALAATGRSDAADQPDRSAFQNLIAGARHWLNAPGRDGLTGSDHLMLLGGVLRENDDPNAPASAEAMVRSGVSRRIGMQLGDAFAKRMGVSGVGPQTAPTKPTIAITGPQPAGGGGTITAPVKTVPTLVPPSATAGGGVVPQTPPQTAPTQTQTQPPQPTPTAASGSSNPYGDLRRMAAVGAAYGGDLSGAAAMLKPDYMQLADGTVLDKNTGDTLGKYPLAPELAVDDSGEVFDKHSADGHPVGRFPRRTQNAAGVFVDQYQIQPGDPQPTSKEGGVAWQDKDGTWQFGVAPGAVASNAALAYASANATESAKAQYDTVEINTPEGPRTIPKAKIPQVVGGGGGAGGPPDPATIYAPTRSTPQPVQGGPSPGGGQPWAKDPGGFIGGYVGGPVRITSGYRSPQQNAAVGGVANSAHLQPNAAYDFVPPPGVSPQQAATTLAQGLKKDGVPFDQIILEGAGPHSTGTHIHVSFAGNRGQVLGVPGYQGATQSAGGPQPSQPSPQGGPQGSGPGILGVTKETGEAADTVIAKALADAQRKRTLASLATQAVAVQDSANGGQGIGTGPVYGDIHIPGIGEMDPGRTFTSLVRPEAETALSRMESLRGRAALLMRDPNSGRIITPEYTNFMESFPSPTRFRDANFANAQEFEAEANYAERYAEFLQQYKHQYGTLDGPSGGAQAAWLSQNVAVTGDPRSPRDQQGGKIVAPTKGAAPTTMTVPRKGAMRRYNPQTGQLEPVQ